MKRKMTKIEIIIWLMLAVIQLFIIFKFFSVIGVAVYVLLLGAGYAGYLWNIWRKQKKVFFSLKQKYGDTLIAEKIRRKYIWEGQTAEQLIDTIGDPIAVDTQPLKHKKREIWKYGNRVGERFHVQVLVENGQVVGWNKNA